MAFDIRQLVPALRVTSNQPPSTGAKVSTLTAPASQGLAITHASASLDGPGTVLLEFKVDGVVVYSWFVHTEVIFDPPNPVVVPPGSVITAELADPVGGGQTILNLGGYLVPEWRWGS